jgi:UDP-N-acetylglucosamine/UDP-N-acetylgalactosamine diphosphorylase
VRILRQGTLPAVDEEGRALLTGPGSLALAPDGHGGALVALDRDGVLDDLAGRGIEVLTTFQVDNPLALPLDPVMLGWMVERRLEAVGKAVRRLAGEKVGVFARDVEGRLHVVEYSEFPEGGMPDELVMGSIALHAFSVPWLRRLFGRGLGLPLHLAHKKVPYLASDGRVVQPEAPNAWKFERFLFDVFPLAARAEVHEVLREREFAPVKNASGADSPATARALVEAEVRRWHEARGLPVPIPPALRPREQAEPR